MSGSCTAPPRLSARTEERRFPSRYKQALLFKRGEVCYSLWTDPDTVT